MCCFSMDGCYQGVKHPEAMTVREALLLEGCPHKRGSHQEWELQEV